MHEGSLKSELITGNQEMIAEWRHLLDSYSVKWSSVFNMNWKKVSAINFILPLDHKSEIENFTERDLI